MDSTLTHHTPHGTSTQPPAAATGRTGSIWVPQPHPKSASPSRAARDLAQLLAASGELVYQGRVSDLATDSPAPILHYERRVSALADGWRAHHLSLDERGQVFLAESAEYGDDYRLRQLLSVNLQHHFTGYASVSADGRQLYMEGQRGSRLRCRQCSLDAPLVSGPTLFGFILFQWARLLAGQTLPVAMLVLPDLRTYRFDLAAISTQAGQTVFELVAAHWLIRRLVKPLTVSFDSVTRQPLRYQGRVPPQRQVGGQFKDWDARVDYRMVAQAYR